MGMCGNEPSSVIKDGSISIHQTLKQVQSNTELASLVMLNLVQHLVITDYGNEYNELTSQSDFVRFIHS
jgi:hypothetical protein